MKQKGFTLIELLAVIIILAVIALIATPIVLNVVDKARSKADLQSVNGLLDAAELYYSESMIDTDMKLKVDNVSNISASEVECICKAKGLVKLKMVENSIIFLNITNTLHLHAILDKITNLGYNKHRMEN